MESGAIPDDRITGSKVDSGYEPWKARFGDHIYGWSILGAGFNNGHWLQIDLMRRHIIERMAFQVRYLWVYAMHFNGTFYVT